MTFQEAIDFLKSKEQPENVFIILANDDDSEAMRKMIVAWPKVKRKMVQVKTEAPHDEQELIEWLWRHVSFSMDDLSRIANVKYGVERLFNILIFNTLIYPDGTVSEYAVKTLRRMVKNRLEL